MLALVVLFAEFGRSIIQERNRSNTSVGQGNREVLYEAHALVEFQLLGMVLHEAEYQPVIHMK